MLKSTTHGVVRLCVVPVLLLSILFFAVGCGGDDDDDAAEDDTTDDDTIDDDATDDDTADDDTTDDDDSSDDDTADDDTADDDTTDDDDSSDDDTTDDDTADDDTTDDDTDDTFVNFSIFDADSGADIEGVICTVVDPDSGEPVDPIVEETSDSDGVCAFVLDEHPAQISVRFSLDGYVTIYRFYVETNSNVEQLMVSEVVRDTIAADLGISLDAAKGIVFGPVNWASESGVEHVGCAEVTHDAGGGDLFYTDDTGYPTNARTSTSAEFAAFVVFNVPTGGPYTFEADTDGKVTQTTANQVFAEALTFIILSYREDDWPDNPTPVGCT